MPEISLENVKSNRLSRWQLWQQILETFWKTWSQDYILSLLVREATVHTASGTYVRPITKLALLAVEIDSQSVET